MLRFKDLPWTKGRVVGGLEQDKGAHGRGLLLHPDSHFGPY